MAPCRVTTQKGKVRLALPLALGGFVGFFPALHKHFVSGQQSSLLTE